MEGEIYINANPYKWPYNGKLNPENTCLMIIDMQTDFCGNGGYIDSMGYDLSLTQRAIVPIKNLLKEVRKIPGFLVVHTREGHRPDLLDLPDNKRWRSKQIGAEIGSVGAKGKILVRGEKGWDIVQELYPKNNEIVIDKSGKGAFYGTDLELILRNKGIENIIFTGITTDVCVHTTMRNANDMGFECLVLEDCTGATKMENHLSAIDQITMSGGIFGAVSNSYDVMERIKVFQDLRGEEEYDN